LGAQPQAAVPPCDHDREEKDARREEKRPRAAKPLDETHHDRIDLPVATIITRGKAATKGAERMDDVLEEVLDALEEAAGDVSGEALAQRLGKSRTAIWQWIAELRRLG